MSSVSSYEGSDKDSLFHRNYSEATSFSRHSYLRNSDFLDTLDTSRLRDTDAWSVAATIDDQESVISTMAGSHSVNSSRLNDRETDDDRSTLDGSIRDQLQDIHLSSHTTHIRHSRIESLRDLVDTNQHHTLRSMDDDDDKHSKSNAAEFGDDGTRSALGDFDHSVTSDDYQSNVLNDQIMAPPQPQPSFASSAKSYSALLEENEILQSQLRDAQLGQKHQEEVINNLRQVTNCDDEIFKKALGISQQKFVNPHHHVSMEDDIKGTTDDHNKSMTNNDKSSDSYSDLAIQQVTPFINAHILTQKLTRLAETLNHFVHETVEQEWRLSLEQSLFSQITRSYLTSLPFGTENQDLLNTAYSDQISRFHNTLGANFAKWYRKQTVQSLSLNPATKEYLLNMRSHLTDEMLRLIDNMSPNPDRSENPMHIWEDVLDLSASLSLIIHGGDSDVSTQEILVGSKFDQDIMAAMGDIKTQDTVVKMVISPLFIDDESCVLLPARVILE